VDAGHLARCKETLPSRHDVRVPLIAFCLRNALARKVETALIGSCCGARVILGLYECRLETPVVTPNVGKADMERKNEGTSRLRLTDLGSVSQVTGIATTSISLPRPAAAMRLRRFLKIPLLKLLSCLHRKVRVGSVRS
jgi:hypothetical protein